MTQQTNLALKKLQGIKPHGSRSQERSLKVGYLINLLESFLDDSELIKPIEWFSEKTLIKNYLELYPKVESKLNNFEFDEKDLSLFVRSVSDVNIEELGFGTPGFEDQKTRFALRGLFSGTLLDLLTTRNNSKGKQTKVSIDFEGYSFPFLFCYARFVDELTIRNANGHAICQGIGSLDGKINSLGLFNTDIWLSFAGNKSSPIDRCIISSKHNNSFHYLTYKSCFFNELWVVDSYPTKVQEWLQSKRDIRHDTDFIKLDVHSIWILNSTLHCLGFRCFNKQIDNLFLVNNGFNYGTTSLVGLPQIDEVVIYDELKRPITINPLKAKNILWNESALDKYGLVIELAKTLDAKNPKLLYSKIDQIKELYGNKK